MRLTRILAVFLLGFWLLTGIGCSARGSFDVAIHNQTSEPLSAGFVKSGGPMDPKWTTPSDIAIHSPQLTDRHWGALVPPGKTIHLNSSSNFSKGSTAYLRIYSGDNTVDNLLAISPGSSDLAQHALDNGKSAFVVQRDQGQLKMRAVAP